MEVGLVGVQRRQTHPTPSLRDPVSPEGKTNGISRHAASRRTLSYAFRPSAKQLYVSAFCRSARNRRTNKQTNKQTSKRTNIRGRCELTKRSRTLWKVIGETTFLFSQTDRRRSLNFPRPATVNVCVASFDHW